MTAIPLRQPSPDWDMVTLRWWGTHLDGSAALGSLEIEYNGPGPLLDPDPLNPLSVFVNKFTVPITTTTLLIDNEQREVGFCQVRVPASNDPDIEGGGGSYSFTEKLTKGGGRQKVPFFADKDAPDGVIYLNTLAGGTPTPGEPLSVVTVAAFDELGSRVSVLEDNPVGGGGVSDYGDLQNVPASFPTTAAQIGDASTVGRSVLSASSATAARDAIGAGTSNLQLGTGPTTAKAGNYQPTWGDVTSKPSTFTPASHEHPTSDVTGLSTALAGKVDGTDARLSDARDTTAARITDATTVGRGVVTAADQAAARAAIGAGISNLAIGTTGTTAAAGNDSRLSDARTPVAHSAALVTSGTLDAARIPSLDQSKVTGLQAALNGAPIVVRYDGSWPSYSTDSARVRHFYSQNAPTAPAPTHHSVYDVWFRYVESA